MKSAKSKLWLVLGIVVLGLGWFIATELFLPTTSTVPAMDVLPPVVSVQDTQDVIAPTTATSSVVVPPPTPAPVPSPVVKGTFTDTPSHPGEGNAAIYQTDAGEIVRLTDFSSTAGPDLFVYLATDAKASEFINLGELKSTQGDQNYPIPEGVDVEKYPQVLIWCKRFGVLFMSATLTDTE